jgi:hypothetical protein
MKTIVIAAAIAVSSMAHASFFTGNDLFEKLNSDTDAAWGMMYIAGVADAGLGTEQCAPQNSILRQHVDIVKQWLYANPTLRHYAASSIVTVSLQQAFPCPKKATKYPL